MSRFKPVAKWDAQSTFEYLCLLVEHTEKKIGKLPKNPTYVTWIGIIQAQFGTIFTIDQLKSKYHWMQVDYQGMCFLRNHTGLGQDDEKHMVVCTDEQWSNFTQVVVLANITTHN